MAHDAWAALHRLAVACSTISSLIEIMGPFEDLHGLTDDLLFNNPNFSGACINIHIGSQRVLESTVHAYKGNPSDTCLVDDVLHNEYILAEHLLDYSKPGLLGYRDYLKIFVVADCPFFAYRDTNGWRPWAQAALEHFGAFRVRKQFLPEYDMPFDERDSIPY